MVCVYRCQCDWTCVCAQRLKGAAFVPIIPAQMEAMSASYREKLALLQAKLDEMAAVNAKLQAQAAPSKADVKVGGRR